MSGFDRHFGHHTVVQLAEKPIRAGLLGHVDAIAKADVKHSRARGAAKGAIDDRYRVVPSFVRTGLEIWLVDLHEVGARRKQVEHLVIDGRSVGHRQRRSVAVEVVLGLLRHRERAGHGDLDRVSRVRPQEADGLHLDRATANDRTAHTRHRHRRPRAVHRLARMLVVDTFERVGEMVRVALAPRLSVGDDVEPRPLLVEYGEEDGVIDRLVEKRRGGPPEVFSAYSHGQRFRQQIAANEPVRLRIATDQARR